MAGIFEGLVRPRKGMLLLHENCRRIDPAVLELAAAKEILQEVFGTSRVDVEEMIRARVDERRGPW